MLLRSITKHVKNQDWFAVVIDFAIVVFGILLAFQITEWNQSLKDKSLEREYLERISQDLERDANALQQAAQLNERQAARLGLVSSLNNDMEAANANRCEYLRSLFVGVVTNFPDVFNQTRNEMVASGGLTILQDNTIKDQIGIYYNAYEAYANVDSSVAASFRPFRELSRGYLPAVIGRPLLVSAHELLSQNGNARDFLNNQEDRSLNPRFCADNENEFITFYKAINSDPAFSGHLQMGQASHLRMLRFARRQLALNQSLKMLIKEKLNQ